VECRGVSQAIVDHRMWRVYVKGRVGIDGLKDKDTSTSRGLSSSREIPEFFP
jgi:hypothetical protein